MAKEFQVSVNVNAKIFRKGFWSEFCNTHSHYKYRDKVQLSVTAVGGYVLTLKITLKYTKPNLYLFFLGMQLYMY